MPATRSSAHAPGSRTPAPLRRLVVLLDNVRSMHNVGSAFRSADAFGVAEIWLCGYTPAPPHRDIQKTALGATDTVPWRSFPHVAGALDAAESAGLTVCAVEQTTGSVSLEHLVNSLDPDQSLALVFGNEVSGVSEEALERASACVEIPQWGAKHSLNVSVAVGVVLWEIRRAGASTLLL